MIVLLVIFAVSCASQPPANVDHLVVEDAKGVPVAGKGNCSKPVKLEDCSNLGGAQRTIEIDRVEVRIAGSVDGRHILIMPSHVMRKLLKRQPSAVTVDSNEGYYRVKALLNSRGIKIVRVTPLATEALVVGYSLELDGDGYSVLKEFSK